MPEPATAACEVDCLSGSSTWTRQGLYTRRKLTQRAATFLADCDWMANHGRELVAKVAGVR